MDRGIKKKLNSIAGETIAETLVALLISAFALVMLAVAIAAGSSAIITSKDKMEEYYNTNESGADIIPGGNITITDNGGSPQMNIPSEPVTFKKNSIFSNKPVVSYE